MEKRIITISREFGSATDNEVKDQVIPNWQEGQHITLSGCTITEGKKENSLQNGNLIY